jgi:hypothetical protein
MALACIFGFHKWEGCKCDVCGKTRDKDHNWRYACENCVRCGATRQNAHNWDGCKCGKCGKVRDEDHSWDGCKCRKCGKTRDEGHDWSKDCERCVRCGATRPNDYYHKWEGCKCSICGIERHDCINDSEICARCGATHTHKWTGAICEKCSTKRFLVYEGTVLDRQTGLMWQKLWDAVTWNVAFVYAEELNRHMFAGYNDWRVPSIDELKSIIYERYKEDGCDTLAEWLNKQGFSDMKARFYWSSTTVAYDPGSAWVVSFSNGAVGYFLKSYNVNYVRCVRGGQ